MLQKSSPKASRRVYPGASVESASRLMRLDAPRGLLSAMLRLAGIAITLLVALTPAPAQAGMGNPTRLLEYAVKTVVLDDSALHRFEAISFFLLALLLSTFAVRWLWNRFIRDFPKLPRLGFLQSFAVVALWGLLFLVVLTMIAGTRELMTPGSWQKKGLLYSLPENSAADPENQKSLNQISPQPEGSKP